MQKYYSKYRRLSQDDFRFRFLCSKNFIETLQLKSTVIRQNPWVKRIVAPAALELKHVFK